jgi:hypothetical protein
MYAARVWIDPLGEYKLFESANDATDQHILHFGLAYRGGEVMRGTATAGVFEDRRQRDRGRSRGRLEMADAVRDG